MIGILIGIVIVGVMLYLIEAMIPLAMPIKVVIRIVAILIILLLLLRLAGVVLHDGMGYRWPRRLLDATLLDIVLDGIASGRIPLHDDSDLEALLAWLIVLVRSHANSPPNAK